MPHRVYIELTVLLAIDAAITCNCFFNYQMFSVINLTSSSTWVRCILDVAFFDKVTRWPEADQWFSPSTQVSSENKIDLHDILIEILLKVTLNNNTTHHNPLFRILVTFSMFADKPGSGIFTPENCSPV
jgi:hypothetical protein